MRIQLKPIRLVSEPEAIAYFYGSQLQFSLCGRKTGGERCGGERYCHSAAAPGAEQSHGSHFEKVNDYTYFHYELGMKNSKNVVLPFWFFFEAMRQNAFILF